MYDFSTFFCSLTDSGAAFEELCQMPFPEYDSGKKYGRISTIA
jgi:hypothetical protein